MELLYLKVHDEIVAHMQSFVTVGQGGVQIVEHVKSRQHVSPCVSVDQSEESGVFIKFG